MPDTSPVEQSAIHMASVVSPAKNQHDNSRNELEEQLMDFSQSLESQSRSVGQFGNVLNPAEQAELDSLKGMAHALNKGESKRGLKRSHSNATDLATWGNEPPKAIEVKRVMQDVAQGIKYAKEEKKAHEEAQKEAEDIESYYGILGVSSDADVNELKKAYRKAMVKCHPDKVSADEREKAVEHSNRLNDAFKCLSDPWERFVYDYFGLKRYLQNAKVIQCFKNYMLSGIKIIKHPRKGFARRRYLWISPDFQWLCIAKERILEPNSQQLEGIKRVRILDIHELTRGITTEVFERTGKPKKQGLYFSIITNERTLDLECESKSRADFLLSRISLLVLDTQKNKKWLQRHFELKALKDAAQLNSTRAPPPPKEETGEEQN